jgi:hypothetical protein
VLPRTYLTDCQEVIKYWSYGTEEEENDEVEEEAVISWQETKDIEDQVQGNFSEHNEESGKEDIGTKAEKRKTQFCVRRSQQVIKVIDLSYY